MKDKIFLYLHQKSKINFIKNLTSLRNLNNYLKYDIEIILVSNDRSNYVDF